MTATRTSNQHSINIHQRVRFPDESTFRAFWRIVCSEEGMLLFTGFGAVPGIARIEPLDGTKHVRVHNTDGTRHEEREIERTDSTLRLVMGGFEGVPARLLEGIEEHWEARRDGGGFVVDRSFVFHPKAGLLARACVRFFLKPQMRVAMARNIRAIQQRARQV